MQRVRTAVKFGFLDYSRYLFVHVSPQLQSNDRMGTDPVTLFLRKYGSFGELNPGILGPIIRCYILENKAHHLKINFLVITGYFPL